MKSKTTSKKKVIANEKEAKGSQIPSSVLKEAPAPIAILPLKTVTPASPADPRKFVERPEPSDADRIAESRKALLHPLPAGQKFFESPDGEIIIGEADKNHMWSRRMNEGRGGWINPRR